MSKALVVKIAVRQAAGQPATGEIARLKSLAGAIADQHQLLRERFAARETVAERIGPVAAARHAAMRREYLAFLDEFQGIIKTLPDDTIPAYLLDTLKFRLEALLPEHQAPLLGTLPYRHLRLPSRLPATTPLLTPAYLGTNRTVNAADLAASPEAQISAEIAALAQSLNWSPVAIYGWVKNNIKSEWYWGVMKGAEETLHQRSGNDGDQAALLVALLRSAGYPARFVRGTIEFFPDLAGILAQTGVADARALAIFFQKAGIPCQPVIRGGRIANLQVEHIWVEAEIPYANYRGAVLDDRGKVWLPLDTQIKSAGMTVNNPPAMPPGVDLAGLPDQYLAADRPESPLEFLRAACTAAGADYAGLLHRRTANFEELPILPASLQFEEVAVVGEYTTLPDTLKHRVRFIASHGATTLFNATLPLADLSNRSLALIYEPATVEDQEIINSYGGLANTPAYLVHLRPVLTVAGARTLIGTSGLPVGSDFKLAVELLAPNHTERSENAMLIGNLAVLGLVAQQAVLPTELPAAEKTAERLLHEQALNYIDQWNRAEAELAALLDLPLLRPLPTLVTLGGVGEVVRLLDIPHGFEWRGVYIDADLRAVELSGPAEKARTFMRLSGLQGSLLEERVLSEGFGVPALSTAKLLGLSNAEGLAPLALSRANLALELPGLALPANVAEDITNAVGQGLTVTIPPGLSSYEEWLGYGYRKEDPDSGEAGWMLSGAIAGGMTAVNPQRWPLASAAKVLANSFSVLPNHDPDAAMFIQKIPATDLQVGTVGQPLPRPLQVYVTDRNRKPVKGAEVIFTLRTSEGSLVVPPTAPQTKTDQNGIASVSLVLGKHTAGNPIPWLESGATHSQQVGNHLVDAALKSGATIASPFTALAKPDVPHHLIQTMGADERGWILTWGGPVGLIVADQYGNSIANQKVTFTGLTPENLAACDTPVPLSDRMPARLVAGDDPCAQTFPTYARFTDANSCGDFGLTTITDYRGTYAQVILGPMAQARYSITARAGNLTANFDWLSLPELDCQSHEDLFKKLLLKVKQQVDQSGSVINAGPVGGKVRVEANCTLLGESATPNGVWGTGNYYLDNSSVGEVVLGYSEVPMIAKRVNLLPTSERTGVYTGIYTLPKTPGVNKVPITCRARYKTWPSGNFLSVSDIKSLYVVGVELLFPYQADNPTQILVGVNEEGYLPRDQVLSYRIQPDGYRAESAYLFIYKDGGAIYILPSETSGIGLATLPRSVRFEPGGNYEAQVVLNPGSESEILSDRVALRVMALQSGAGNGPPNLDPDAAMFIQKVTATDQQTGSAGHPLPKNLQVYVTDSNHWPVQGAEVIFTVKAGGGTLDGQPTQTVNTDNAGIASVELVLGGSTLADSTDYQEPNIVDAALKSGATIADPFIAYALTSQPPAGGQEWIDLALNPESGVAAPRATPPKPFTTTLRVDPHLNNPISSFHLDWDYSGDALAPLITIDSSSPDNTEHQLSFNEPGVYTIYCTIIDSFGAEHAASIKVDVLDRDVLDFALKQKWDNVKTAWAAHDVEGGLAYFAEGSKANYRGALNALVAELPQIVSEMQDIELVYARGRYAKYRLNRLQDINGTMVDMTYYLYFVKDHSGLWKVDQF